MFGDLLNRKTPMVLIALCSLLAGLLLSAAGLSAVSVPGRETPLDPDGLAHEVYRDQNGDFWISDYYAGEIWMIKGDALGYAVYEGLGSASSGMTDQVGNLWWSDFDNNSLGRYVPGSGQATRWKLPQDGSPLGLAIDSDQRVWVTDAFEPNLYRIDPAGNQICHFQIPNDGAADYVIADNGRIWLGDTVIGRILRFDPLANTFTVWSLASGAYPQGLAVDEDGLLWWADAGLGLIGRLNGQTNQAILYEIPGTDPEPISISIDSGAVWYSDYDGFVGVLNPSVAQGQQTTLGSSNVQVSPSCTSLGSGSQIPVSQRTGTTAWTQTTYDIAVDANGWRVYELPDGAQPWGMAAVDGDAWFVDQGKGGVRAQQFGQVNTGEPPDEDSEVYLPALVRP